MIKWIKRLLILALITVIGISALVIFDGYNLYREALAASSIHYKLEKIKSDKNYITLDELPEDYKNAVIAVEDHRFYKHGPIDVISIGRAVFTNVKEMSLVEGGSTITQQVAKNIYFTQEKKMTRKIAEIFMAYELEKNCSKDDILELYVNTSYFGDGYYGIKEACQGYLDKKPSEMNLDEASLLAGVPNAPSAYAPSNHPDLARKRQKHVLKKMVEYDYISEQDSKNIIDQYPTKKGSKK